MDKRTFLKISTTVGIGAALGGFSISGGCATPEGENDQQNAILKYPFELAPLAYAADALEPHFDARTMEIHHGRHHQAYVNNLNNAVMGSPFESMDLKEILAALGEGDAAVRNNGGGHYNHALFWDIIGPDGGGEPEGALRDAINASFGNTAAMKEAFKKAALGVFGSGWAWLTARNNGSLEIVQSPNQDNPLMYGLYPGEPVKILMGIDVWEHAYYLHYQNRRGDYIDAYWNVIRWNEVASRMA